MTSHQPASVLRRIMASKWQEIGQAKEKRPADDLVEQLKTATEPRDFFGALAGGKSIRLIAEVKKASPSRGVIRAEFDPPSIARLYQQHGASCVSVLTDAPFFHGSLEDLTRVRQAVDVPVLRKDFLLDSYQLLEARCAGADAVLLIAECLDDCQLRSLHNRAIELGMCPLVECYEAANIPRALEAGATLIGINNRDLRTFQTDLNHCIRLRRQIPADCLVVGESGIHGREDVLRLEAAGVNAMLVGEHLMSSPDIGLAVDALLGRNNPSP